MADYHSMYLMLASAQADMIDVLEDATQRLIKAHLDAEQMLLGAPEFVVRTFPNNSKSEKDVSIKKDVKMSIPVDRKASRK